ncbi:MAG: hypothetical protein ABJH72_02010 [Reichenbachiella sp.]|uniref:hypothetical protein n=1 Tax=Reichenbachiella sp. TaxID=2184521 RepID=UPI0032997006
MKISFILMLLVCMPCILDAQSWQRIKHVDRKNIDTFTLDHVGNIYVTDGQGSVPKYDESGELILEYASVQLAEIHEIVATSQLKVTLFYKDLQEFVILNRYLASPVLYRFSDFDLGYVEGVTQNYQQALWVVDLSSFSLKMIDVREKRLLEEKSLALIFNQKKVEIMSFQAHQNRMYLIDIYSGVQVFDNIGNFLFRLMEHGPEEAGFDKDYLYYQEDGFLNLIHLYSGPDKRLKLPPGEFSKIRYSDDRLVAVTAQGFDIYKYLSSK